MIDVGGESGVTYTGADRGRGGDRARRAAGRAARRASWAWSSRSTPSSRRSRAAAIDAGAAIVNDVSGLRDPALARRLRAATGAALVLMHTRAAPKQELLRPGYDGDVVRRRRRASCASGWRSRASAGVARRPAAPRPRARLRQDARRETVEVLRALERLQRARPAAAAAPSRASTSSARSRAARRASARAGTLAARRVGGATRGAAIFRLHDVAAAADFLAVRRRARRAREPSSPPRRSTRRRRRA